MQEVKPDAVLVLGDTNSCLSVIAAKRLHIPIFHMEAGNRCFDECLPEGVKVLAQALRRELQSGQLSPFDRSFSTQDGRLINAGGGKLSIDEILHMDYLCSCVSGHIPSFDEILPMARSMVRLQGVYRDQIPPEQEAPL